jgi:hypothetical protein
LPAGGERRRARPPEPPPTLLRGSLVSLGSAAVLAEIITAELALPIGVLCGALIMAFLRRRRSRHPPPEPSTGATMSRTAWLRVAADLVAACSEVSVLRIDSDAAGARRAIGSVQDGAAAVGRFGPAGLAAVLTDQADAEAVAARARLALLQAGIDAHLSVAAKPRDGNCLADLLAVTEAELITSIAADRPIRPSTSEAQR